MEIRLDYGRTGLTVRLPDGLRVSLAEPSQGKPLPDPPAAVARALEGPVGARPLAEVARGRRDA
jgi:hypothetical protein